MEDILNFIKAFETHTLIGMTLILWYFTRSIRNEIKEEIAEIRNDEREQSKRTDRLYEMFIDLLKSKS